MSDLKKIRQIKSTCVVSGRNILVSVSGDKIILRRAGERTTKEVPIATIYGVAEKPQKATKGSITMLFFKVRGSRSYWTRLDTREVLTERQARSAAKREGRRAHFVCWGLPVSETVPLRPMVQDSPYSPPRPATDEEIAAGVGGGA
jgi:hypothetical protein